MLSLASCCSLGADAAGWQATTHGTLPWTASHERRAVLEPPYHVRLRRPIIDDDGSLLTDEEAKVLHSFDWLKVRHARGRL